MIIQRILNNNVVIVKNKKGQEEIVCGKGIAFKKKVGEFVDVSAINKVFTLRGRKELEYFQELWEEIPVEYFKVADDVVGMIKLELGKKISDTLYISLIDHIYMAQRLVTKTTYDEEESELFTMVRDKYDQSYQCVERIAKFIQEEYHCGLSGEEKLYLTIHIERVTEKGMKGKKNENEAEI